MCQRKSHPRVGDDGDWQLSRALSLEFSCTACTVVLPLEGFILPPEWLSGYINSGRTSWVLHAPWSVVKLRSLLPPPKTDYLKQRKESYAAWAIYLADSESFASEVSLSVGIRVPREQTSTALKVGTCHPKCCHRDLGRAGANGPESQGQTLLIMVLLALSTRLVLGELVKFRSHLTTLLIRGNWKVNRPTHVHFYILTSRNCPLNWKQLDLWTLAASPRGISQHLLNGCDRPVSVWEGFSYLNCPFVSPRYQHPILHTKKPGIIKAKEGSQESTASDRSSSAVCAFLCRPWLQSAASSAEKRLIIELPCKISCPIFQ